MPQHPQTTIKCNSTNCSYNTHSKHYLINHWGFLLCVIAISIITYIFFHTYNTSYKKSQEQIIEFNEHFLSEHTLLKDLNERDSVIVYKDIRPILDSHQSTISSNLRLEYDKIQHDFVVLTIWASVLMILFLIFSIYSMFKIDEIQKQSRESLKQIDDTYSKVREKSDNLDTIMSGAMARIEDAISQKIAEFTQKIQAQSQNVENQISEYKKTVSEAADNNLKVYDTIRAIILNNNQHSTSPEAPQKRRKTIK